MKKTIDFIAEYQKELQEFQQSKGKEPTNLEWERFNLTSALVDAQESQFKKSKSQEKIYQLEHIFYPCLCDIAKTQGGRVELEIDDETFFAQLVYIGYGLTLNNILCTELSDFSAAMSAAEDVFISVEERGIKIQFIFHLYDKVQVADHSAQIAKIKQEIQFHHLKKKNGSC